MDQVTGRTPGSVGSGGPAPFGGRASERLAAGLLVDLRLADRRTVRRWQEAVKVGDFDPDACARELLAASAPDPEDPRLLERAARLQRDLLMAPLSRGLRGAGRRVRGRARRGLAFVLANLVGIGVYTAVLLAILILVRLNYGFSLDEVFDGILDGFRDVFGAAP